MTLRTLALVALVACSKGERSAANGSDTPSAIVAPVRARTYAPDLALPDGATRRLGGTRFRVAERISAFAVSPDGAYVALGGGDDRVTVWRTATGEQVFTDAERSPFDRISAVAFAKGAFVYASGSDPIRVVSTSTWIVEREIDTCKKKWVVDLAASPDGTRVAVTCEGIPEIRLQPIDGSDPTKIYSVKRAEKLAWSADGAWLATTSIDSGNLLVIDVAKGKVVRRVDTNVVSRPDAIAFAPKGAVLAWSDERDYTEEKVRLWDVASDKELGAFDTSLAASAIAFSPDGTTLVYAQDSGVYTLAVVNLATNMRREIMRPKQHVKGLAFAGAELWLASDQAVRAWDIVNDREIAGPSGHRGGVLSLAFRPDGAALASGSDDGSVRMWDLATGTSRELAVISDEYGVITIDKMSDWRRWPTGSPVIAVAWSRDSARLYSATGGTGQGVMRRWNAATGLLDVAYPLQDLHAHAFALAPDESVTYSVGAVHDGEDTMRVMSLSSGTIARRMPSEHEETLALSPDGTLLARDAEDGLEIVDALTGAVTVRGLPTGVLAFSQDSKRIAVGGDSGYQVFRVGETTAESDGYTTDGRVTSMAFTPDGRLVFGHHRGDVVVVRPGAEERVVREKAHVGAVHAVAVAPDGKSFASGGADGQILIWPL
jgi:WD40 repeat protein